jgi:hypothetical protein
MASHTVVPSRKHRTAADFYEGEFAGCFYAYASPYCHPDGNGVFCIVRIQGLGRPWELCPQRDLARKVLEKAFPVLTSSWMRFDFGFNGSLIWHQYIKEVRDGAYEEWRIAAWTIFNETPDLLRLSGIDLLIMNVEPLPGPWKWQFL